jgi:hypothetical protein
VVIAPLIHDGANSMDSHIVDSRALLALTCVLYGRVPRAWLVTVDGERFEPGEELSKTALQHAEVAAQQIAARLS